MTNNSTPCPHLSIVQLEQGDKITTQCTRCGKKMKVVKKPDHTEQHLVMVPTPRTDAASFSSRDPLELMKTSQQLERELAASQAEVARLRELLKRAVEVAETACKYLHTGGWNEDEMYSGKDGWVTETEIDEVCATLAVLKSEIK